MAEEGQELRNVFARIDANGDGRITPEELQASMLGVLKLEKSVGEISAMMKEFDANGDGTIDFPEFVVLVRSLKEQESKRAAGNAGLASVVDSLLKEWDLDATDPELGKKPRTIVPLGMQYMTTEQLSRAFQ